MVRHRQGEAEWWCLPGGAVLDGETPAEAALRELEEECRVRGRVVRETSVVTYGPDDRHYTYLVDIGRQEPALGCDPEHAADSQVLQEVRWMRLDALSERDRAFLWTAGLLSVPPFGGLVLGWGDAVSYPCSNALGAAGHIATGRYGQEAGSLGSSSPSLRGKGDAGGTALRIIEHRRHTMRAKPGRHLSQPGVDLARRVGEGLGPFHRVVTSSLPRAFETALAMGFAVDEQVSLLASLPDGFEDEVPWDAGIGRIASAVRRRPDGTVARFAHQLAAFHRDLAARLPDGGRALVISHGGIVEASAVGCKPDGDYAGWGPAFGYCEGVRMYFHGTRCERIEPLRVAAAADPGGQDGAAGGTGDPVRGV